MPEFQFGKPEDSPGFLLWQTTVTWQRMIKKALDPYDISHPQFVILALTLWFEFHGQAPTQIMIINKSKLDKMTVSKSLKKLVMQGLVQRTENTEDTRSKLVQLTPEGKIMAEKLLSIVNQIDHSFFSSLKESEQQAFIKLLDQLVSSAST